VGQIEHGVVEGVEAGQGDELELEAHGDQLSDQSCKTPQHRHRNP
jgi:hypothetical protein